MPREGGVALTFAVTGGGMTLITSNTIVLIGVGLTFIILGGYLL